MTLLKSRNCDENIKKYKEEIKHMGGTKRIFNTTASHSFMNQKIKEID